jgi:hypothetical protein
MTRRKIVKDLAAAEEYKRKRNSTSRHKKDENGKRIRNHRLEYL